jgi:hypothetical protein
MLSPEHIARGGARNAEADQSRQRSNFEALRKDAAYNPDDQTDRSGVEEGGRGPKRGVHV